MTQPSVMQLDNTSGAVFRTKLNEIISAHTTDFAGNTAPAAPVANMVWQDTSVDPPLFRRRNASNSAWDLMGSFSNEVYSGSCVGSSGSTAKLTTPRSIAVSGAATGSIGFDGSSNVTIPLTLADSGAAAGTYGNGTNVPVVVVNSKGLITGISTTPIIFPTVVSTFNSRSGTVTLNTADVFGVLPSKTGNGGKVLALNSAENGIQWIGLGGGAPVEVLSYAFNNSEADYTLDLKTTYGRGFYKINVYETANSNNFFTFRVWVTDAGMPDVVVNEDISPLAWFSKFKVAYATDSESGENLYRVPPFAATEVSSGIVLKKNIFGFGTAACTMKIYRM